LAVLLMVSAMFTSDLVAMEPSRHSRSVTAVYCNHETVWLDLLLCSKTPAQEPSFSNLLINLSNYGSI
jgi:hypothetical protein